MLHSLQTAGESARARAAFLLVLTAGLACSQNETAPKYQVDSGESVVNLTADDLGIDPALFDQTGAQPLWAEPTKGEFPAAICVVQVEAFVDSANSRKLRVVPLPSAHAIYWNHLFDELPVVREVVFLGKPGLDPRGCHRDDILRVANARDCALCLIYARIEETDADAEYVGILWNTATHLPLASVRTPVVLPIEVIEELKEEPDIDRAVAEADFRSEQDFRRMVRDIVWDFAGQDVASADKASNPWKNYVPPLPPMNDRNRFMPLERPVPYNSPGRSKRDHSGNSMNDSNSEEGSDPPASAGSEDPVMAGTDDDES